MKYYSKSGQDRWVAEELFKSKRNGFYVDVGAYDGITFSNTKSLEDFYDWRGICIEPNDEYFQQLIHKRNKEKNIFVNECVWSEDGKEVEFICQTLASGIRHPLTRWNEHRLSKLKIKHTIVRKKTKSLVTILRECGAPKTIDFISIDAEGSEEKLISSELLQEYNFSCLLVEVYTECIPEEKKFNYPESVVHDVLKRNSYKMIKQLGRCEYFYVPEDK